VVRRRDPLIADFLRCLRKFPQRRRLTADIDNRKGYAEPHLHLRLVPFVRQGEHTMRQGRRGSIVLERPLNVTYKWSEISPSTTPSA